MKQKPYTIENLALHTQRLKTTPSFISGTGSSTYTALDSFRNKLNVSSGSAGRAWDSASFTMEAGVFYRLSVNIDNISLNNNSQVAFKLTVAPTVNEEVTNADIVANGAGRYSILVMDATGGSFTWRCGVGVDSNQANDSFSFYDIQIEKLDDETAGPGPYVFGGHRVAFNYIPNYEVNNKFVTEGTTSSFEVEPYNAVLVLGDSQSDEEHNLADQLADIYGRKGVAYFHAESGLTTAQLISTTITPGAGTAKAYTLAEELSGTAWHRTWSTDDDSEHTRLWPTSALKPDVCVIAAGINDVLALTPTNEIIRNITTIGTSAAASGMLVVLVELTPFKAYVNWSDQKGQMAKEYNAAIKRLADEKGWLFVPTYAALGDSTDPDKLSDGLGSTPNYSVDGLHRNDDGNRLVAGLIKEQIDLYRQKVY